MISKKTLAIVLLMCSPLFSFSQEVGSEGDSKTTLSYTLPKKSGFEINADHAIMRAASLGAYFSLNDPKPNVHWNWNFHFRFFKNEYVNLSTEVDYTSGKKDVKLSGWKFTPLNASYIIWERDRENVSSGQFELLGGCGVSYLLNNNELPNAWLISPHITFDTGFAGIKIGYDYDMRNKVGQFGITSQGSLTGVVAGLASIFYVWGGHFD